MLIRRNLAVTLRRFGALMAALAIGAGLLLSVTGLVRSASESAAGLDTDSSLSVLEVPAQDRQGANPPLTAAAVKRLAAVPGVESAVPYAQFGFTATDARGVDRGGVLWATPRIRWIQPRVVAPTGWPASRDLGPGEAIVPDRYLGESYTSLVGQKITATYILKTGASQGEGRDIALRVVAAYDNSVPGADGESAVYVDPETFRTLGLAAAGVASSTSSAAIDYTAVYLKTSSSAQLAPVQKSLSEMGFRSANLAASASDLPGIMGLVQKALPFLAGGLMLLGVGLGASLASTWGHLRRWDVGLLSALGWSRRKIATTFASELVVVGLMASAAAVLLGIAGGLLLSRVGGDAGSVFGGAQGLSAVPPFLWLAGVLVGLPAVLLVGGITRVLRLARLEPDVALRRRD